MIISLLSFASHQALWKQYPCPIAAMGYAHERLHDVHGSLTHPFDCTNMQGMAFFGEPTMMDALEYQLQRLWLTTTTSGSTFYYRWNQGEHSMLCLYQEKGSYSSFSEMLRTPGVLRCAFGGDTSRSLMQALNDYGMLQKQPYAQSLLSHRATQGVKEPLEYMAWVEQLIGLQTSG